MNQSSSIGPILLSKFWCLINWKSISLASVNELSLLSQSKGRDAKMIGSRVGQFITEAKLSWTTFISTTTSNRVLSAFSFLITHLHTNRPNPAPFGQS